MWGAAHPLSEGVGKEGILISTVDPLFRMDYKSNIKHPIPEVAKSKLAKQLSSVIGSVGLRCNLFKIKITSKQLCLQ